jgi:formylmethanofuran dehydrogenase subunit E
MLLNIVKQIAAKEPAMKKSHCEICGKCPDSEFLAEQLLLTSDEKTVCQECATNLSLEIVD